MLAILLALSVVHPVAGIHAQSGHQIRGDPACPGCRIDLLPGPLLGNLEDDELIGELIFNIARTGDGKYLVAGAHGQDRILVFDADGTMLQVIGRRGQGPGEFWTVTGVGVLPGDSIIAYQPGRISVFDPAGRFVRTAALPWQLAAYAVRVSPSGNFLLPSWVRTAERAGLQFHLLNSELQPIRSFGTVPAARQAACSRCATYSVAWSTHRPGHFWALAPNQYEIELWHESGALVSRYLVASRWFEPWNSDPVRAGRPQGGLTFGQSQQAPTTPPPSQLGRVAEDANGLLWVSGFAPSAEWAPVPPPAAGRAHTPEQANQVQRNLDRYIEVIDPDRRVIVASTRFPARSIVMIDERTFWSRVHDPRTGIIQIQIWHATLRR
jgi:hypothetical protein